MKIGSLFRLNNSSNKKQSSHYEYDECNKFDKSNSRTVALNSILISLNYQSRETIKYF